MCTVRALLVVRRKPGSYRLDHGSPVPPVLPGRKGDGSARRALDDADHERTTVRQQPLQRAASRPADHVADAAVETDAAAGPGGPGGSNRGERCGGLSTD